MVERKKPIFLKVIILVVLFLLAEAAVFIYFYVPAGFTGLAVSDISDLYGRFYPSSKIFLVVQWAIIAVLLLAVYIKNMRIHHRNEEVTSIDLKTAMRSSKTNLDTLYNILKTKKQLRIKTVAEIFKVEQDLAIEWARILESGDLVMIDYPGMGSPIVRLKEEEINEQGLNEHGSRSEKDEDGSSKTEQSKDAKMQEEGKVTDMNKKVQPATKALTEHGPQKLTEQGSKELTKHGSQELNEQGSKESKVEKDKRAVALKNKRAKAPRKKVNEHGSSKKKTKKTKSKKKRKKK